MNMDNDTKKLEAISTKVKAGQKLDSEEQAFIVGHLNEILTKLDIDLERLQNATP